jgi:hypothetical protein
LPIFAKELPAEEAILIRSILLIKVVSYLLVYIIKVINILTRSRTLYTVVKIIRNMVCHIYPNKPFSVRGVIRIMTSEGEEAFIRVMTIYRETLFSRFR